MGAFIAALLALAGTILTGVLSNNATKEAQNEARQMYQTTSANEEFYNKENLKLNKQNAALNRQQVAFARDAELYSRGERATERGMVARNNRFQQSLSLINGNETLKTAFLNNWKR